MLPGLVERSSTTLARVQRVVHVDSLDCLCLYSSLIHRRVVRFTGFTGQCYSEEVEILPMSEPLKLLFLEILQHELVHGV